MTIDFIKATQQFQALRVLVVGDMLLDHYISGTTERTSPEAPVPVVLVKGETYIAGGAANVVRNIAASGASAVACGLIGKDAAGDRLIERLQDVRVDTTGIRQSANCHTIVKTRVVSQGQQIVRLDHEEPVAADGVDKAAMETFIDGSVAQAHAVIISDYGKGFLSDSLLNKVFKASSIHNIPVMVDPKGRHYSRYRGAYAITPNSREAQEATGIATNTEAGLREAAEAIMDTTGCRLVIITRGSDGLALLDEQGRLVLVETSAREVFDVTGAGDTFVSWLTLGVVAGMDPGDAARLANLAAGIAVGRSGPAMVSPLDMRQALAPGRLGKKIISENDLGRLGEELRQQGKKVVLTNGCFDFLHAGHVAFLQQARALGDVLVLATNTDDSIRRLKGAPRPVIAQRQREELLASIEAVDYVTAFSADTPHDIIKSLRPDVLVKGSNYSMEQVEGAELVQASGGEVMTLPIVHDISTSKLVKDRE
jgi:D-beta-D-heptose 7-phosphate kinase/D-beta-D-heptose 1-phosphate adenosyltransferase